MASSAAAGNWVPPYNDCLGFVGSVSGGHLEVSSPWLPGTNSSFETGDIFELSSDQGRITAKHITGKSRDHEILIGDGYCGPLVCRTTLTIVLDGKKSNGFCTRFLNYPDVSIFLDYTELRASLHSKVVPPDALCGDTLPNLSSRLLTVSANSSFYSKSANSSFSAGDVLQLDGIVDKAGGHVAAKRINGTSPDHEIIFGNSTCLHAFGPTRSWPLMVVVDGQKFHGHFDFQIDMFSDVDSTNTAGDFFVSYTELKVSLTAVPSTELKVSLNETSIASAAHDGAHVSSGDPSRRAPSSVPQILKVWTTPFSINSSFKAGDLFQLEGEWPPFDGQKMMAKQVNGKGLDHEIIVGNHTCDDVTCWNPLTIVLNGRESNGTYTSSSTPQTNFLEYAELAASLHEEFLVPDCGDALPNFNSRLFDVIDSPAQGQSFPTFNSSFKSGDVIQLNGIVAKSGGHVAAKHITGISQDLAEVIFGNSTCLPWVEGPVRSWPLTIPVHDYGRQIHGHADLQRDGTIVVSYTELGVTLKSATPPACGDEVPNFNSSYFGISPEDGSGTKSGLAQLNGTVDKTGGHIVVKHVTDTDNSTDTRDHELIFGNSTCEGSDRIWPLTVVVDGTKSFGSCTLSSWTTSNKMVDGPVTIRYNTESSQHPVLATLKGPLTQHLCDYPTNKKACLGTNRPWSSQGCFWCTEDDPFSPRVSCTDFPPKYDPSVHCDPKFPGVAFV